MYTTNIIRFEGDTLRMETQLITEAPISNAQRAGATVALIFQSAERPHPAVDVGGVLSLQVGASPDPMRATLEGATMPPPGHYRFRMRVTFADETDKTFPNERVWDTLEVVKSWVAPG